MSLTAGTAPRAEVPGHLNFCAASQQTNTTPRVGWVVREQGPYERKKMRWLTASFYRLAHGQTCNFAESGWLPG
jgi:hypothetical protein